MPKTIAPNPKADIENGVFEPESHDQRKRQIVVGLTLPADDTFTAVITAGAAQFRILSLGAYNWFLQDFDPNEFPHHRAPPPEWRQILTNSSSAGAALAVKAGQRLNVEIAAEVLEHALPPGPFSGSLTVRGGTTVRTVPLSGVYLAVDEGTSIGRKWRQLGGERFTGEVRSNAHLDPDLQAIAQEFGNGTIVDLPGRSAFFLPAPVLAKWKSTTTLGDSVRAIGMPTEDAFVLPDGSQAQRFRSGAVVIRPNKQAFVVRGPFYEVYRTFGDLPNAGRQPRLGLPVSDEQKNVDGRFQTFDHGTIWWSPATGAHEVHGDIEKKWMALGGLGSQGFPGWPLTDELGAPDGIGRFNQFQGGVIYWSPATRANEVHGPILARWSALGSERSYLGYPISGVLPWLNPATKHAGSIGNFEHGQIAWTNEDGTLEFPETFAPPAQQVVTPAGTSLGGSVAFTLRSNGSFSIHYQMHDSGLPAYDFTIRAIFVASNGMSFAGQHGGHVGGTVTTGSRDDDFPDQGSNAMIQKYWPQVKSGTLYVTKDYSATGVIGFIEDVAKAVLDVVATVAGITLGVVIWLGSEIGQIFGNLGLGGTIGLLAGVIVFACGGGIVLAGIAGVASGAVTDLMIKQRSLRAEEITFINQVFKGVLSTDKITITNVTGLGGRQFTFPGVDKRIYVNLGGDLYDNPSTTITANSAYRTPGQVLIHELTHAWQIQYGSFIPGTVCEGIVNQANNTIGESVYEYGPPSSPWSGFNLEAQGAIVDQWFGGTPTVNSPLRRQGNGMDLNDPYFPYIRDNILAKQT